MGHRESAAHERDPRRNKHTDLLAMALLLFSLLFNVLTTDCIGSILEQLRSRVVREHDPAPADYRPLCIDALHTSLVKDWRVSFVRSPALSLWPA
jgi:hypothetical protein